MRVEYKVVIRKPVQIVSNRLLNFEMLKLKCVAQTEIQELHAHIMPCPIVWHNRLVSDEYIGEFRHFQFVEH
jgi:hypothetical protein